MGTRNYTEKKANVHHKLERKEQNAMVSAFLQGPNSKTEDLRKLESIKKILNLVEIEPCVQFSFEK